MTNEYTSRTTWADVAREEEAYWNRPRCSKCGEDFGLTHVLIHPYGEDWFCDECWEELISEEG